MENSKTLLGALIVCIFIFVLGSWLFKNIFVIIGTASANSANLKRVEKMGIQAVFSFSLVFKAKTVA